MSDFPNGTTPEGDEWAPAEPASDGTSRNATPKRADAAESDDREPFPVVALPEPMRSFVHEVAASIDCEPAYVGLAALVTAGAAIGNARRVLIKRGYSEPCVFWGAIVGAPGAAKSAAMKACVRPLRELDGRAIEDHARALESYERDLDEWRDAEKRRRRNNANAEPSPKPQKPPYGRSVVDDATIESLAPLFRDSPRGLLRAVDELSGMIANMGKYAANGRGDGEASRMLTCFDAGTLTVDRRAADKPPIHVPRAALSVLGTIQPGPLREAMGPKAVASGSAARYLFATSQTRRTRWSDAELSDEVVVEWRDCLVGLRDLPMHEGDDGRPLPNSLPFDREATELWRKHHDRFAPDAADGPPGLEEAAIKLRAYAARFALVVAVVSDPEAVRIDLASLRVGIRLAEWFYGEAETVYAMLGTDDRPRAAAPADAVEVVREKLNEFGVATVKMLRESARSLRPAGVPEAALETLRSSGEVLTADTRRTGVSRGPKTPVYWLADTDPEALASSGFNAIGFPSSRSDRPGESSSPRKNRGLDDLDRLGEPDDRYPMTA